MHHIGENKDLAEVFASALVYVADCKLFYIKELKFKNDYVIILNVSLREVQYRTIQCHFYRRFCQRIQNAKISYKNF